MKQNDSIVIVGTYNESENLEDLVSRVLQHPGFDLLVIDDNSPDGTGRLADVLASRNGGRVQVLHRPQKQGLGSALKLGFSRAVADGYDHIFQMDADLSHDPARLPELRRGLERADVVIGSRYVAGGATADWATWRHSLSRLGSVYASLLLGLRLKDVTGGYKGFRREVLETLPLWRVRSRGFAFQIEMNYLCARWGFRILELPITFQERVHGHSKMSWRIVLEALQVVTSLRLAPPPPLAYTQVDLPPRRTGGSSDEARVA